MKIRFWTLTALVLFITSLIFFPVLAREKPKPKPKPSVTTTKITLPEISAGQQANIQKLAGDLQKIKSQSQITPEMKNELSNDLMNMCKGAQKPSTESVNKLVSDLTNALADKNLSKTELLSIAKDLHYVLNSANITDAQISDVLSDVETILTASGVTQADANVIIQDLNNIINEIKA